jgi:probable HAF family extracellular repeat protein
MKTLQLLIITCVSLTLTSVASAQKYHAFIWNSGNGLTDLGTLGGDRSYALGINDSGQVVGYSDVTGNQSRHAFTWTGSGGMVDLGTLPGGAWSEGQKINASGEISGEAVDSHNRQVPVYWSARTGFVALGENQDPSGSYGYSINDFGMMTGQIYVGAYVNAFYWRLGRGLRFVPPLSSGIHMAAYDINNNTFIVGEGILPPDGRWEAFVWSQAAGTVGIGFVPGAYSTLAHAINDNNEVTGLGYLDVGAGAPTSAFYWKKGTRIEVMQTLGGVIGAGLDINLAGTIVGWSSNASEETHAALWSNHTSVPQDLGVLPGGTISYAYSINSSGQVVGFSDVP